MVYLVKKMIKGKNYYYLVKNIRISNKTKKIQVYAGITPPSGEYLDLLKKRLKEKSQKYVKSIDPLIDIISETDKLILEDVQNHYKKLKKQSPAVIENYYEWFITTFTYNSNAIEGSTLNERETGMLLFERLTPQGRPLKDVLAAENHKKAYDWLMSYKGDLTKKLILDLHKILTSEILQKSESGRIRRVGVYIRGGTELPPEPEKVEAKLKELLKWYKNHKKRYHPVVVASYFHVNFEKIHPFVDFNGRTGRLLLNFILHKNNYPPIDIRNKERMVYYMAIRRAIENDLTSFVELVVKYLKEFLKRR